jgi:invasion protein IalB
LIHKTYEPVMQRGSGFAVHPSGVIVAAGGVVQVDDKQATN